MTAKKKIKKRKPLDKWECFMFQIQQEAVLMCDCVQKGIMDEGMIMIKISKDADGNAVIDVGHAIPDEVAEKLSEMREARKQ